MYVYYIQSQSCCSTLTDCIFCKEKIAGDRAALYMCTMYMNPIADRWCFSLHLQRIHLHPPRPLLLFSHFCIVFLSKLALPYKVRFPCLKNILALLLVASLLCLSWPARSVSHGLPALPSMAYSLFPSWHTSSAFRCMLALPLIVCSACSLYLSWNARSAFHGMLTLSSIAYMLYPF